MVSDMTGMVDSFSKILKPLLILGLIGGIIYWLKTIQGMNRSTEIRVYRAP